jgi:large subunit ribosomal protein L31
MKSDIHPDYHTVLYQDSMTGEEWISRSTIASSETRDVDGEKIPVIKLEVTSYSQPFWTGHPRSPDPDDPPPSGAPCAARLRLPSKKWKLAGCAEPVEILKRAVGR